MTIPRRRAAVFNAAIREAACPPHLEPIREAIVRILAGESVDLRAVPLDLTGIGAFERRVYAVTSAIPPGETLTYGEVAARIGEPGAARAVGQALGQNPFPIIIPCHRVLAAGGKVGGFSGHGGIATKLRLLTIERARTSDAPMLFDALPLAAAPGRRHR